MDSVVLVYARTPAQAQAAAARRWREAGHMVPAGSVVAERFDEFAEADAYVTTS